MNTIKVIGSPLYQWEVGRQVQIFPVGRLKVSYVHFSHLGDTEALVVIPTEEDGRIIVDVPNVMLQSGQNIVVYIVDVAEDRVETLRTCTLPVRKRAKPADYVYTETEVLNYAYLDNRLNVLEGEGLANAVNEALAQAKASGAFDYVLTEADKQEIAERAAGMVEVPEGGTVTDEQIASAVEDYMAENPVEVPDNGLTSNIKSALMAVVEHIGTWTDANGQAYIDNLRTAICNAPILFIKAVYSQSQTVYVSDNLEVLKDDLVVTATYTDGTSFVLTNYTLEGTLTVGTSTVTVAKDGKSTTFEVEVTAAQVAATGITLDKATLSLASIAPVKLTATVTPDNATDTVVWASSEEAVAKVSSDGTVTPVSDGTCVISATVGDFTAECAVSVSLPLTGYNYGNPYLNYVDADPTTFGKTDEELHGKWYNAAYNSWGNKLGIVSRVFLHPFTPGTHYIRYVNRVQSPALSFYAFANADIVSNPTATLGKVGDNGSNSSASVTRIPSFDNCELNANDAYGRPNIGKWTTVDGKNTEVDEGFLVLFELTVPDGEYVFMGATEINNAARIPGYSDKYPINDWYTIFESDPSANIMQIVE